ETARQRARENGQQQQQAKHQKGDVGSNGNHADLELGGRGGEGNIAAVIGMQRHGNRRFSPSRWSRSEGKHPGWANGKRACGKPLVWRDPWAMESRCCSVGLSAEWRRRRVQWTGSSTACPR